jgi:hypothetical protein
MAGKLIRRYRGGQFAPDGIYLKKKAWDLTQLPEGGGMLPDDEGVAYYRVPLPLMMVLGPAAGLAFILFLPLAVPVFAAYLAIRSFAGLMPWRRKARAGELRASR